MLRALGAFAVLAVAPLGAQQPAGPPSTQPPPQITVSATGEARVTPDRATIFVGVQTRAATAAQAGSENARKQRAVIDTMRALGVPSDRISTVSFNVYPEQVYNPDRGDKAPRITGYVVTNTVRVDVQKLDGLGRLIDAAIAQGGNEINSLQFYSSAVEGARRDALASAVAKARADAEVLAKSAGGHLGTLLELSSASSNEPPPPRPMAMMARDAAAEQTPVNPGTESVTVAISARWSFVAGAK